MSIIEIDNDIIIKLNQGDKQAFKLLYSKYYVYLCAVSTKYVFNIEEAKEIVNDVFLTIWDKRETLEFPIKTYLIKAVQNRSLNHLRNKRQSDIPLSELDEFMLAFQEEQIASGEKAIVHLENEEFEELVQKAIHELPEKCRKIFMAYLYQHKTYEEIATMYEISESTVRGQVRIALSKLKGIIGDYYPLFLILFNLSTK